MTLDSGTVRCDRGRRRRRLVEIVSAGIRQTVRVAQAGRRAQDLFDHVRAEPAQVAGRRACASSATQIVAGADSAAPSATRHRSADAAARPPLRHRRQAPRHRAAGAGRDAGRGCSTPRRCSASPATRCFRRIDWATRGPARGAAARRRSCWSSTPRSSRPRATTATPCCCARPIKRAGGASSSTACAASASPASGLGPDTDGVRIDVYGSQRRLPGQRHGRRWRSTSTATPRTRSARSSSAASWSSTATWARPSCTAPRAARCIVLGNAAGRPLINAVGRPRVVINGTCLDFLAESFMAGDPLNGGGFVILNGIEFDGHGRAGAAGRRRIPAATCSRWPAGGAIYVRDPRQQGGRAAAQRRRVLAARPTRTGG